MRNRDLSPPATGSNRPSASALLSREEAVGARPDGAKHSSITNREQAAGVPGTRYPRHTHSGAPKPAAAATSLAKTPWQRQFVNWAGQKLNKKTVVPIIIVLVLMGGGGFLLAGLFAPGIAAMQMVETLTKDLNSSLAGMDRTNSQLWRAKLQQTTAGSCGAVKIACRFKTVDIKKTEAAYHGTGISMEFDRSSGFGEGRGKITKMTYVNPRNPSDVLEINNAEDYNRAMRSHTNFRTASINAKNPQFHTLKNAAAMRYLGKIKTSYAKKLTGTTTQELDRDVERASGGRTSLRMPTVVAQTDEDGNETGRYVDSDGKEYTAEEARNLNETERRVTSAPSSRSVINDVARGTMITGIADTACSVYNTSRAVSFAAKTIMAAELARYAMIWLNAESAMRAGDATPEQVEYMGKKLTEVDMRQQVVDESKLDETPEGQPVPMIDNPNYKKAGMDAAFFKQSAYQDTPRIDLAASRFVVGAGLVGTLDSVNRTVANALGASSPRELTQRCRVVQNPVVRGGSLVVGVLAGAGSLGATTAFSIAGSVALGLALPYLVAHLGEMIAGEVTGPDLTGVDMVNATAVGTSVMLNGVAREQGMLPMSPEAMAEYQNVNRQVEVAYAEDKRLAARDTPFDITNQYSFLGSLARTTLPIQHSFQTGDPGRIIATLPNIFSLSASAFSPQASAFNSRQISADRYQQCPDETYREMNMAADSSCSLLFGLPREAMEADPVEVAEWMAANNEIDPESDAGTPIDNDNDWNYKKFIESCVNKQPGAYEDIEENPDNGYPCVDPANYEKNWRYAKFTVSKNWNEVLDGDIPGLSGGSDTMFGSGESGSVNADGWAFPTTTDAVTTSPFGPRGGSMHRGVDLAQPGSAEGKPLFAARDGEVIAAGPASGFGMWIVIRHDVDGARADTVYGHMWPHGVFVSQGDRVRAGQEIGTIGNNGQSTGPHLHFEIWENGHSSLGGSGEAIDPAEILESARGGSGDAPAATPRRNGGQAV